MSKSDFAKLKKLGILYNQLLAMHQDEDFVINQEQLDKLTEIVEFFTERCADGYGKIDRIDLNPKEWHGGVTVSFIAFYIHGDQIKDFCRVMSYCSAITVDSMTGDVRFSVTIPYVFVLKDEPSGKNK